MAKAIALVQTNDRNVNQLQQNIAQAMNPILNNAAVYGNILSNIELQVGSNTISHGLAAVLQGWSLLRIRSGASIYDAQDSNSSPEKTLILVSNAIVTVNLYVF